MYFTYIYKMNNKMIEVAVARLSLFLSFSFHLDMFCLSYFVYCIWLLQRISIKLAFLQMCSLYLISSDLYLYWAKMKMAIVP